MQGHLDDLLFDSRRLPWITVIQQERAPRTAVFSAPVPLLALPGLAMTNDVGPVTVRTVQDLENHDATRSRWGSSVAETRVERSTSTPVRHFPWFVCPWPSSVSKRLLPLITKVCSWFPQEAVSEGRLSASDLGQQRGERLRVAIKALGQWHEY